MHLITALILFSEIDSMKKIFTNNTIIPALIVLTGCLIAVFYIVIFQKKISLIATPESSNPPQAAQRINWKTKIIIFTSLKPEAVVTALRETIDLISENSNPTKQGLLWKTKNSWTVLDNSAIGFTIPINIAYPCERSICVRLPMIRELNESFSLMFRQNGFVENKLNSSASEDDEQFYDYILAFQKDNTVCTLTTNPDVMGEPAHVAINYVVACSDEINRHYAEQLPFLMSLNDPNASVQVQKISSDFALVEFGYRREGMYGILKKINGTWHILHKSQESPPCELITQYGIPEKIYKDPLLGGACYEKSGDTTIWKKYQ